MKLNNKQITNILNKCGYKTPQEVVDDARQQLAIVILSNMQVQQPKNVIPYGYSDVKSGPSVSDIHDFDDYEYVQKSYDRN